MRYLLDLNSPQKWLLTDCAHRRGEALAQAVCRADFSPAGYVDATVPGLATQDLIRCGRIPDPYWGDNTKQARFIEERDFVYRTTFEIGELPERGVARLLCDSLDTFASVFVNGTEVATHENQFRRLKVDVKQALRPGTNVLAIAFEAGFLGAVRRAERPLPFWNEPWERLWVRKSQMSYGWDWAARTPTVGIAGPIRLEVTDEVFADDLHVRGTPNADGSATVRAGTRLFACADLDGRVEFSLDGQVVADALFSLKAGQSEDVLLSVKLDRPKLWYPRELGTPHLYDAKLVVKVGERSIHESRARLGIRSIELIREDSESPNGKAFYFKVNGERIWAKGENWIPLDGLHTRVTEAQYRSYLELLIEGNVNLLRLWGGGIIEHRALYELCDELGLLIWHDFGFACGIYPNTPRFLEEVEREAEDVVRRLRSHASIALWCGNNENEALAVSPWLKAREARFHPIYYDLLPKVCRELDPERPYWPGSPASESGEVEPDSDQEGDRHNWDVWFGWQSSDFIKDRARFNSEFGAQSFPQRESLESFLPRDHLWSPGALSSEYGPSPGYLFARHGAQLEKLFARAAEYGPARSLDAAIATTQMFQADTLGRYIRHYRAEVAYSGGVVVWNYTSTWPSICWALVDWYRRPKHAYYECRRLFGPVCVGIEPSDERGQQYQATVSLDRRGQVSGTLQLSLLDMLNGEPLERTGARIELRGFTASAPLSLKLPPGLDRKKTALVAEFLPDGGKRSRDVRYLTRVASLRGTGGELTALWENGKVTLRSTGWRLRVGVEAFESPVVFSDNYFEMLPGEERVIEPVFGVEPTALFLVADMGTRVRLLRDTPVTI